MANGTYCYKDLECERRKQEPDQPPVTECMCAYRYRQSCLNNPMNEKEKELIDFNQWFEEKYIRQYSEYEKNKEKLMQMLGSIGEKEAPMEVLQRLEEVKILRKMQYEVGRYIQEAIRTAVEERDLEIEALIRSKEWKWEQKTAGDATPQMPDGNGSDYLFARIRGFNEALGLILQALKGRKEQT